MKKIILIFVIALLVLIIGCKKEAPAVGTTPFIGGSEGIALSFVENAPPAEVYDSGTFPFDIEVKLENKGEQFVPKDKAKVVISGINPNDFGKSLADMTKNPDEDLIQVKKDASGKKIDGIPTYITFPSFNFGGNLSGNTPYPIRADLCYKYGTTANAKLCFRSNLLSTKEGVCTVNEAKTIQNSGAPVQITSFDESTVGKDKISFTFTVEHVGTGAVYKRDTWCDSAVREDENKVYVTVDTGLSGLACSGLSGGSEGEITLIGGKRLVRCTQAISNLADFEKVAKINLEYNYKEHVSTQILVKHITA